LLTQYLEKYFIRRAYTNNALWAQAQKATLHRRVRVSSSVIFVNENEKENDLAN